MDKAAGAMSEEPCWRPLNALDHIEPEELADRLMAGTRLLLVDVPAAEFDAFHIRGAITCRSSACETLDSTRTGE